MKTSRITKNEIPAEIDLFEQFDAFLTGLIIDRAPVDARTGLGNWLGTPAKKSAKAKARGRKGKAILATA